MTSGPRFDLKIDSRSLPDKVIQAGESEATSISGRAQSIFIAKHLNQRTPVRPSGEE